MLYLDSLMDPYLKTSWDVICTNTLQLDIQEVSFGGQLFMLEEWSPNPNHRPTYGHPLLKNHGYS